MKAVIYARYSSDNQREESIEGQLRECTAYCVKNDITILRTYIDRALSAKTDNRPDFQRMVKDSAKGLFDVVIVWKLDRFARNRYDSAHYKAQLRKYGVKVLSATENISEGPEGIILESMLEGMAEYYSAELSEKVIRGHTENALKCKYNGGTPTFGYVIDKDMQYQLDPRTAPVVLEIFTRYDQGATMKEIMEEMRQKGVTTVRGKKIDLNFMARLLKNRKYIGEYSYREIVTPGGIPAIVPQDLFDRVQKRLAANRKAPARHKAEDDYLLTTKLFCGTCGAMMVGESGTSASKGRKYHYYRCVNTKKQKSCNAKHKSIRKTPIENAVVNAVMAKVMDDNFVEYIADTVMDIQTRESSVLPALRHQLEETERGITNMLNAIQMGIINASTKQRLDELEDRKADIELQIIQEEMKHPMLTREDVTYWICRFRTLDVSKLEERRRLIDSFVNSVTVFDDYILITFNYKEGEERLDFTDIESSDLQSVGGPSEYPLGYSDFLLPICKFSHVVAQECATFVVWEPVCRRTCSLLHTGGLSMTEENYNYRTSQKLLRNQFPGKGKLKIPIIPKFQESPGDFDDLLLIGFDKTHLEDQNHLDRMVHFFLYDYRFERVWKNPDNDIEKLSRYRAVLSPDFSMYLEMAPVMQLYNVFRNRWCGAYWASKGLRVIPTVNWGDESTFDFCFEGIEKGSVVAVSTYMASEHDNRCDQKEWFMAGYNEMLRRIEPEKIICYNTPFPEMQGNIIHVDYERSSWRYMNYERSFHREDLDAFKIGGTSSNNRDTIEPYLIGKGGGSAYGGEIKPSKPEDERFWGAPGETKYTYTAKGELIETLIGPDGKAYLEIHHTNHGFPKYHEVPHQHSIIWDQSGFHFGKEQTTKSFLYGRNTNMATWVGTNSLEDNRFKTISDFKQCMRRGGEVQFEWNGVLYCCFGCISPAADAAPKMVICQAGSVEVNTRTEKWCDTADEILEYMVGGDRLRDVITQVKVWERTI